MKSSRTLMLIILLSSCSTTVETSPIIVSTDWLAERLSKDNIVILHVGGEEDYAQGHIPAARLISASDVAVTSPEGLQFEMPDYAILQDILQGAGIGDDSKIVVYTAKPEALHWATRVFLTLEYAGLKGQVSMLDGGLAKWKGEARAIDTATPQATFGILTRPIEGDMLVSAEWILVNASKSQVHIVDGRPAEYYRGTEKSSSVPKYGHIDGAVSIPLTEVQLDEYPYTFRSKEDLASLFAGVGISPGDDQTVVPYCDLGIWGSVDYVIARHLGYDTRFYDGSLQDWTKDESRPVVKADTPIP